MLDISKITITVEMVRLIGEIDEFKGAWKFLGRIAPERLQALYKVATIESIGSSTRIEGSKLSDRDVEHLFASLEKYAFSSRDEQEVAGYAYVCKEIFEHFECINFSENMIKQLHGWLLKFSLKDQHHRGEYKKLSNQVEAFDNTGKSLGIIFETTSPFETPLKMQTLIAWVQDQLAIKILHPLLIIGIFAVVFLAIHPFEDGNGRLSRILTSLLLLKAGYQYVAYSSLESIIEKNKESYYLSLRRTQKKLWSESPELEPWLLFFLRGLQKQKIHLDHKIEREKILHISFSQRDSKVLELLQAHGQLGVSDIEKMVHINRNTLKKCLSMLMKKEIIVSKGKGKATQYMLI